MGFSTHRAPGRKLNAAGEVAGFIGAKKSKVGHSAGTGTKRQCPWVCLQCWCCWLWSAGDTQPAAEASSAAIFAGHSMAMSCSTAAGGSLLSPAPWALLSHSSLSSLQVWSQGHSQFTVSWKAAARRSGALSSSWTTALSLQRAQSQSSFSPALVVCHHTPITIISSLPVDWVALTHLGLAQSSSFLTLTLPGLTSTQFQGIFSCTVT